MALNTALVYVIHLETDASLDAIDGMANWEVELCRQVRDWLGGHLQASQLAQAYMDRLDQLLDASGTQAKRAQDRKEILAKLTQLLPLAAPVEILLTQGGDSRLALDRQLRLNKYGCSPVPRPWAITFSSCTATSISERSLKSAYELRQALIAATGERGLATAGQEQADALRAEIADLFELQPDTDIVLGSSGTDVELLLSALVLRGNDQGMANIVIAPEEVGGGGVMAAQARHFDDRTPMGVVASRGATVDGMPSQELTIKPVAVRDRAGQPLPLAAIDREVRSLTGGALNAGKDVLLHLLDSSKTGLGGPSFETAAELHRNHPGRVWVVADVAQMRISTEALTRYLDEGFILIVTGSKFYTGPPFAGALVMPAGSQELATGGALPDGLWDYFAAVDVPARWAGPRPAHTRPINIGLLVRWAAALAEMQAFHAVPSADRERYFIDYRDGVTALIEQSPEFDLVDAPVLPRPRSGRGETWDQVQTIFSFTIRVSGELVDMADAAAIYHWLNRDISRHLPVFVSAEQLRLARKECHIGQPVCVGHHGERSIAALRLAPGARFASRVHADPLLGDSPQVRIEAQINDARTALAKIALICEYWKYLEDVRPAVSKEQQIHTDIARAR